MGAELQADGQLWDGVPLWDDDYPIERELKPKQVHEFQGRPRPRPRCRPGRTSQGLRRRVPARRVPRDVDRRGLGRRRPHGASIVGDRRHRQVQLRPRHLGSGPSPPARGLVARGPLRPGAVRAGALQARARNRCNHPPDEAIPTARRCSHGTRLPGSGEWPMVVRYRRRQRNRHSVSRADPGGSGGHTTGPRVRRVRDQRRRGRVSHRLERAVAVQRRKGGDRRKGYVGARERGEVDAPLRQERGSARSRAG